MDEENAPRSFGLFPHQRAFVDSLVRTGRSGRYLLVGPPGTGKSAAISYLLGRITSKKDRSIHTLVITPPTYQQAWRDNLQRFGNLEAYIVNSATYRLLEAITPAEESPWLNRPCIITSVDFIKDEGRLSQAADVAWDAVVLDEADQLHDGTLRGRAADAISKSANLVLASTAVPVRGWFTDPRVFRTIRWTSNTLASRQSRIHFTRYRYSAEEQQFEDRLVQLLARTGQTSLDSFMGGVIRHRWTSSLGAIDATLRRYAVEQVGAEIPNVAFRSDLPDGWDPPVDVDLDLALDKSPLSRMACYELLSLLDRITTDSKWVSCEQLLSHIKLTLKRAVIIFTDFADTAQYLQTLSENRNWASYLATGRQTLDERAQSIRSAASGGDILITTSRTALGESLTFTDQILHYDVPWDQSLLAQRFGRVAGSPHGSLDVDHYVLTNESTATETQWNDLQKRTLSFG